MCARFTYMCLRSIMPRLMMRTIEVKLDKAAVNMDELLSLS